MLTLIQISIHALLAESDNVHLTVAAHVGRISIHALLAESDARNTSIAGRITSFLSTLSLRRATAPPYNLMIHHANFYPRSPCGERLVGASQGADLEHISIHALLAESDQNP